MSEKQTAPWSSDRELMSLARAELFSSVIGDALDQLGYQTQFLPPNLRPISNDQIICGRAMPVVEADAFAEDVPTSKNEVMSKPFGLMFEALDSLKPGDIYICAGASPNYALWGGLMSTRAMKLKAAGAVLNGYHRDTNEVLSLGFPVMSIGSYGQDQGPRGKVIDYGVPIVIGGVQIAPGDFLFGDIDGIVCVPKEIEVVALVNALEKVRGESEVRKAIEGGMTTVAAFEKFGIM